MTKKQDIARKRNWAIYKAKGNFALIRRMLSEYEIKEPDISYQIDILENRRKKRRERNIKEREERKKLLSEHPHELL